MALQVLDMVDAIGAAGPGVVPRGTPVVAPYITGTNGIAWPVNEIQQLAQDGVRYILRIDQANQSGDAYLAVKLLAVDVEPGAATPFDASHIAVRRAQARLYTVVYCDLSDWPSVRAAVAAQGEAVVKYVRYWIADWSNSRSAGVSFIEAHEAEGVIAVQYQSLSSTDKSVISLGALEGVYGPFPAPKQHLGAKVKKVSGGVIVKAKKVSPKVTAAGIAGAISAAVLGYLNSHGAHLTHLTTAETSAITAAAAAIAGYVKRG